MEARLVLFVLVFITGCRGQTTVHPIGSGGGSAGNAGDATLSGTPDTLKLVEELTCIQTGTNLYDFSLFVTENDPALQLINGTLIEFECIVYDHPQLVATTLAEQLDPAEEATCPAGNATLTRSTAGTLPVHSIVFIDFDTSTPGIGPCGSTIESDRVLFFVNCKRDHTMDQTFDGQFVFDIRLEDCPQQILAANIAPGDIEVTNLERVYEVTLDLYESYDETDIANLNTLLGAKSDDADKISGDTAFLGTAIYAEACIAMNDSRHFFDSGNSLMGLELTNCAFSTADGTRVLTGGGNSPSTAQVSNTDGCGRGVKPAEQWTTGEQVFSFGIDPALLGQTPPDTKHLQSPNCFRSKIFEFVSFARADPTQPIEMKLTCDVNYCTEETDGNCFGTLYGGTARTCSSRRRRSYPESAVDLPKHISTTFILKPDGDIATPGDRHTSDDTECLEEETEEIVIVVVVCTLVLLLVVGVGMVMMLKLKSISRSRKDTDSVKGLYNKAYE